MTVCIAAACEHGNMVVAATDGALSYGGLTADTGLYKGWWFDDWLFMYSGEPSSAELITEEMRMLSLEDKDFLKRERILKTIHMAYRKHFSRWAADAVLSPFDIDLEEFKKEGRELLGENTATELALAIRERAQQFTDQILLVGWGKSPRSAMIHEENSEGSLSHTKIGLAAIGSGGPTATSHMLLLGHNRNRRVEDAIYAVAAGKFASEQAYGVGRDTSLLVTWKRRRDDPVGPSAKFFEGDLINELRTIWEEHGRPKIPASAYEGLTAIAKRAGLPDNARSDDAISNARWENFCQRLNAPPKPGEKFRKVSF